MKKILQLALGILTAIGGFFDIGNLVTGAQAGASFRFQLLWALALGTLMVIVLVEMSGRFAAVSGKTIPEAVREHFGVRVWAIPFLALVLLHVLTLGAEIGGVAYALQLITGVSYRLLVIPVGVLIWLFLWRATFSAIEYSTALLGMVTVCFVVAAVKLDPPRHEVMVGLLPTLPKDDAPKYWLYAVSIIGALLAPYLFYFYSSGAVEDKWDQSYRWINRGIAVSGMTFGAIVSAGCIVVAGMALQPRDIAVDSINQMAMMMTGVFPHWGFALFAVSMGIACVGAASEVALSLAYTTSQTLGWEWGENMEPAKNARFALTYTSGILVAALVAIAVNPLALTIYTMALNAALLPIVTVPFLLLMNDKHLLRKYSNRMPGNATVLAIVIISLVLFVVSLPLLVLGGG